MRRTESLNQHVESTTRRSESLNQQTELLTRRNESLICHAGTLPRGTIVRVMGFSL
jgi:hypothetical protein